MPSKTLAKFTVTEAAGGYDLHIEDEAGHVLELAATRDQIDLIAETLETLLDRDDASEEVGG